MASAPPSPSPQTTARSEPAASITARMSSIRVSSVVSPETPVGHPRPAFVEHDQPRKRHEPSQEALHRRVLPAQLDVVRQAGDPDEVERAFSDNLVGDVDVPARAYRVWAATSPDIASS